MLSSLQPLIRRFAITRHMALSLVQNVRCVLDNPRKHWRVEGIRLPTRLERSKRSTLVISSTDLIPRSWNPFDCESATGQCSNSVPRDTRRIRDLLQRIHDCWFLIERTPRSPDQGVPIVPNREHIAESPNQWPPLSMAPRELTPCE